MDECHDMPPLDVATANAWHPVSPLLQWPRGIERSGPKHRPSHASKTARAAEVFLGANGAFFKDSGSTDYGHLSSG